MQSIAKRHARPPHFAAMALVLVCFAAAYNVSRITHELGHAGAAMIDGAGVERIDFHPLSWSHTIYIETPSHPTFVRLAGSVTALLFWAAIAGAVRRVPVAFVAAFVIAMVTWMREAVYLAVDGLTHAGGDASKLIDGGLPAWVLLLICVIMASTGLVMWRRFVLRSTLPGWFVRSLTCDFAARLVVIAGGVGVYLGAILAFNHVQDERMGFWIAYTVTWFAVALLGVVMGEPMHAEHPVILFDGVCNLCCRSVQFVIKRDPADRFRFASIQSQAGRELAIRHGLDPDDSQSMILIDGDRAYVRSSAVLRINGGLRALWPIASVLLVVPPFVRDPLYRFIATNRYRWFGQRDNCMVPPDELKSRFLQ